jgi:hypothetical protein
MKTASDFEPDTDAGYERRDVNIRAVLWLGTGVAGCALLAMAGLWFLLNVFEQRAASSDPSISPLAADPLPTATPPLQRTPVHDYQAFRASQEQELASYGWVDREQQIVRIPIDRAMQMLLERGEPAPVGDSQRGSDKQNGDRNG